MNRMDLREQKINNVDKINIETVFMGIINTMSTLDANGKYKLLNYLKHYVEQVEHDMDSLTTGKCTVDYVVDCSGCGFCGEP